MVGASVGAINASYFASAPNAEGVASLSGSGLSDERYIFPFSSASAFGLLRHPDNIINPSRLRRLIETHLSYARLEEAAISRHVVATDLQGLKRPSLSSGPRRSRRFSRARRSRCIPPVYIDGRPLTDGAIAANTPIRIAAELGASRIIVLPTGYACALKYLPKGVVAKALHAITLMITWQLKHEMTLVPETIQLHLAPMLCPLEVSPYDFSASKELIERAARSTTKWIEHGGLTRRALPQEVAAHRHHG